MQSNHEPTPQTHVFVGTFRPQKSEIDKFIAARPGWYIIDCPLGHGSHTTNGVIDCWQRGCFDTPVYKTIEEVIRIRGEGCGAPGGGT